MGNQYEKEGSKCCGWYAIEFVLVLLGQIDG